MTLAAPDSFASLPAFVARELDTMSRVVVVLLDAFGWAFVQRHARHPLLARVARDGVLAPMASQFPSTTTAHVTTMHTGLPVQDHGLYEWRVWEPAAGRVLIPLLIREGLGVEPRALLPDGPSFYQRLAVRAGVASTVFSPARFSPSVYDGAAIRGAELVPYDGLADGARALAEAVARAEGKSYMYLYWDEVDMMGHVHGPASPEFDDACLRALDAVYTAFFGPQAPAIDDTLLVLTADHGQVGVSPDAIDLIDVPGTVPAGSARDLFLHVEDDGAVDEVMAALEDQLGDRAEVVRAASLFPAAGPRLTARLAPIAVLPAPGRMVWHAAHADDIQLGFRGHHGGRTPEESTTFVGALRLG